MFPKLKISLLGLYFASLVDTQNNVMNSTEGMDFCKMKSTYRITKQVLLEKHHTH
jgi:hypothetical protein